MVRPMVVPPRFVFRTRIRGRILVRLPPHSLRHRCGRPLGLAVPWTDWFGNCAINKSDLRKALRKARREHVAAQPDMVRGLLFNMPPSPLLPKIDGGAVIGLYHSTEFEAPTNAYARFFQEAGHRIALPYFAGEASAMEFREHTDPFGESDLEPGPFGIVGPTSEAKVISPDIVFVPLIGFTESLERLGQGGGHYDRWLAAHPDTKAIGLAWDVQLCEELPTEPHDMKLDAVITPTRMYGLD